MKKNVGIGAKKIAIIAVMAAILEAGKLALSFLPNIEVVTLFTAVFGYVFGALAVPATCIFVVLEIELYGFGSWSIAYLIHWNVVCFVFWMAARKKIENRIVLTLFALVLTFLFGVLTSLLEIGLFSGIYNDFGYRFLIYYSRGAVFYVIQIVCNAVLFPCAFKPLVKMLFRFKEKYFTT